MYKYKGQKVTETYDIKIPIIYRLTTIRLGAPVDYMNKLDNIM